MATLLGIDLGSYSVKVARFEVGLRSRHLISIEEHRLPRAEAPPAPAAPEETGAAPPAEPSAPPSTLSPAPTDESLLHRQLRALTSMLHTRKGETSVVALGGEVTLRLIEMPFADAKKVAQALPFELAGQLMTELDDQIVDQLLARPVASRAAGGQEEPASLWLAACAPQALVKERLAALGALGLDPRLCGATALAGAALLAESARGDKTGGEPLPLPLWVVDLGHRTTHVCAVAGHPGRRGQLLVPFARTMARGGAHLTQALARALLLDYEQAEERKHHSSIAADAVDGRAAAVLREALRPLLRDLRQTLAAYVSHYGEPPQCMYLTGGTAQLAGLPELLSDELGIEARPLLPPVGAPWLLPTARELRASGQSVSGEDPSRSAVRASAQLVRHFSTGATAVGLALSGAGGTAPQLNFRKGELSYRTDYAFLREKAPYLAGLAVSLLVCVVLWAWASLKVLEKESDRLRQQLISESTALFGEARTNGHQVSAELAAVLSADKGNGQSIPTVSALDILEDISKAAPKQDASGPAKLDVTELNIRPKKTEIKATAASAQYADDLAAALGKLACFKTVQKGKVLTVRNVGPDNKPFDVKQFSLDITTTCP
jgi:Tfp pilus assembly PilM family ATPase